jgi:hypothetical protein
MAFLPTVNGLQVAGLFFAYLATTVIYRRFFHPLAKIPGPFLAAATSLYGFYFNGVKGGVFYLEIERLHRLYGMVLDTQCFLFSWSWPTPALRIPQNRELRRTCGSFAFSFHASG